MIRSQSTAETGSDVAVVGACCEKGGIGGRVSIRGRVGISGRAGIGASLSKDIFGPSGVTFLLHRALSMVYSRGVGEWALPH